MMRRPPPTLSRRKVLIAGGLAAGGLGATMLLGTPGATAVTSVRRGIAFDTTVSLKASHADTLNLERALDAAWAEIVHVEEAASLFRPDSALCRLNRDGVVHNPPARLVDMLQEALAISHMTDGAFDPAVQPLWRLYDDAYKAGGYVTSDEIARASALVGWRDVIVGADEIAFARPGMALTLNGIAQGFATGRCLDVLRAHGIENAFIDTGDIGAAGSRDGALGRDSDWTAAIADPRDVHQMLGLAQPLRGILATSGDCATVWSSDYMHHHILDPDTSRSPFIAASVSVLAQSGGLADGLSTAMMVMGPEKSIALAERLANVEVLIVTTAGARFMTAGFPLV